MPDLLAGTTILALDTPPSVSVTSALNETSFTNTVFEPGVNTVGVVFTAPTTGRVRVSWNARYESNTIGAVRVLISTSVRTGGVIGSGTEVSSPGDGFSLETPQDDPAGGNTRQQSGNYREVSGLTPGDVYNAFVVHRVTAAGSGDIFDRAIAVIPRT